MRTAIARYSPTSASRFRSRANSGSRTLLRSRSVGRPARRQRVLPALLPIKRRDHHVLKALTTEQMLQRPPVRRVRDQKHTFAVVIAREVTQELARLIDDVAVALAVRERRIDTLRALRMHTLNRCAVQIAIVALAQANVLQKRNVAAAEGDFGCLNRTAKIGGEDNVDPVVAPAFT